MDSIPVSGLVELEEHMEKLAEAPDTSVNAKLFDDVELQLTGRFVHSSTTTNKRTTTDKRHGYCGRLSF
jgi:hypothetical protein